MDDFFLDNMDFFENFAQSRVLETREANANWELDFLHQNPDPMLQYINQVLLEEETMEEVEPLALQTTEKSFYESLVNVDESSLDRNNVVQSEINDAVSLFNRGMEEGRKFLPSVSQLNLNTWSGRSESSSRNRKHLHKDDDDEERRNSKQSTTDFSAEEDELSERSELRSRNMKHRHEDDGDDEEKRRLSKQSTTDFSAEEDELSERSELRSRNMKHRHEDDGDDEEKRRLSKQSTTDFSAEEDELSEMFDRVLLNHAPPDDLKFGETAVSKPYRIRNSGPDLSALLMSCAQSIAANDPSTANETLKLIKKHVSPTGDPVQRLANIFANALEARLEGTGHERYISLTSRRISASEQLKVYRVIHSTPFTAIPVIFGNHMILRKALKAKTLHIIDFGIGYGFQWPSLIQHLSQRPNGPPKLKITGIDIPQPGLRPVERAHNTGTRLAKYCERFSVPFEYNAIVTKSWESIKVKEMNVSRAEVLVVNCKFLLSNLLDETVSENSPKDSVLKLIRSLNPDILLAIHVNAQLASPFFLTRFREAFFFFSTVFDALDSLLARDDEQRLRFEQAYHEGLIMKLVACEGWARVERSESYKQWQTWCIRAGFKLLPLRSDLVKELRDMVKKNYHKGFVLDEDGFWLLQGWKGKFITAISCWVPT